MVIGNVVGCLTICVKSFLLSIMLGYHCQVSSFVVFNSFKNLKALNRERCTQLIIYTVYIHVQYVWVNYVTVDQSFSGGLKRAEMQRAGHEGHSGHWAHNFQRGASRPDRGAMAVMSPSEIPAPVQTQYWRPLKMFQITVLMSNTVINRTPATDVPLAAWLALAGPPFTPDPVNDHI